jgi:hypothetical protein
MHAFAASMMAPEGQLTMARYSFIQTFEPHSFLAHILDGLPVRVGAPAARNIQVAKFHK